MVEVDGEECAMDGRRDDKCRGRPRKHKVTNVGIE